MATAKTKGLRQERKGETVLPMKVGRERRFEMGWEGREETSQVRKVEWSRARGLGFTLSETRVE